MNNPSNQPIPQEERRRRNILTISLTTGIIFVLVAAISGYVGYSDNGIKGLFGLGSQAQWLLRHLSAPIKADKAATIKGSQS